MKIVYLIQTNNDPEQLFNLVNHLNCKTSTFVIQLDDRMPISAFKNTENWRKLKDIHFLHERYNKQFGAFNSIQFTLNALSFITKNIKKVDRVVLLSGQDYPIKSLKKINKYFEIDRNSIFIEYFKIPNNKWVNGGKDRFPNYSEIDSTVPIYGGSEFWAFPIKIVRYILKFLDFNQDYIDYFKIVSNPSESFFQTLLLNCDEQFITKNLKNMTLKLVKVQNLNTKPCFLSMQDYKQIKQSPYLFASKFDSNFNASLLDLIDSKLLTKKTQKRTYKNNSQMNKQALLFLTNKDNPDILNEYKDVKRAFSSFGISSIIYHHDNDYKISDNLLEENPYVFDNTILKSLDYTSITSELVPGSNHFPLLKFYLDYPDYDFYWYIEDDVRYNPGWDNFFEYFSSNKIYSDFISSNITDYNFEPEWYWWNSLNHPESQILNTSKVRSFNPLFRISNSALKFVHSALSSGWYGHHEVLIPTLLKNAGFKINDFGGSGPYVLDGCENRFYLPSAPSICGTLYSGSFRFRPVITEEEMKGPLLYHPVKLKL